MHNYMAVVVKIVGYGNDKKLLAVSSRHPGHCPDSLQEHVSLALSFWDLRFPIDAP